MGGVVDAVVDLGEGLVGAVGDVFEGVVDAVEDVFKGVGDVLEDVGKAIGDAGAWIDDNVLQPMLDDPVKTIATIAAIGTGNAHLVPYINAADAAAKGGSIEDIGKAYAISYAAGQVGGKVGTEVAGQTGSQVAGNIAKGTARGATTAALSGNDIAKGAVFGGAVAGAGEVVSAVKEAFKDEPAAPTISLQDAKPLGTGITPGTTGEGFEPLKTSAPGLQADKFTSTAPTADYSLVAPVSAPTTTYATEGESQYEMAPTRPTTEGGQIDYGIDSEKIELLPTPDQEFDWNAVGNKVLKDAQKALGQTLIQSLFPTAAPKSPTARTGADAAYEMGDAASAATATVGLGEVGQSKYDLKTFENDQGSRINIPFKDDEPQMPIPEGYKEVSSTTANTPAVSESIEMPEMAKGGLAKKSKPVVQSATIKPKTRKGLAVKKV